MILLISVGPFVPARAGNIYWTDEWLGEIRAAAPDGANVVDVVTIKELSSLQGLALDLTAGKVYDG